MSEAKSTESGSRSPAKESSKHDNNYTNDHSTAADAKSAEDLYYEADGKEDDGHCAPTDSKLQDAKVEEALGDDEILEKLQRFFFEDARFGNTLETFVASKCDLYDLHSDEYKLQYTSLYEEYKVVFENMLEGFIASDLHCSIHDVYRALKNADEQSQLNPNSLDAFFSQVLIASTDFEVFMSMLKDAARQRAHK